MKKILIKLIFISLVTLLSTGCAISYTKVTELNTQLLHKENRCVKPDKTKSAWYIGNLYDCKTKSWFIPYELWSGAEYKGDKKNSRYHQVDKMTSQRIISKNAEIKTKVIDIKGIEDWKSPTTNQIYQIYKRYRPDNGKMQYFVANDMGLGRVFDSRYGEYNTAEIGIKFPAGYGWKLNEVRSKGRTALEIISLTIKDSELISIKFKWWTRGELDHIYTYKRNKGMIQAEQQ